MLRRQKYKMDIIKGYRDYIKVLEKSINKNKSEYIERLLNADNYKDQLTSINKIIENIKYDLRLMSYDDIIINEYDESDKCINIEIKYRSDINTSITMELSNILQDSKIKDVDDLRQKIFGDGERLFNPDIEIHKEQLNKIDVNYGLPLIFKGLGLGKKIYKKLIHEYLFISSNYYVNSTKPTIESDMVWSSLSKDTDLFFFSNENNIIVFFNDVDFNIIEEKLLIFYKDILENPIKGKFQFDDDIQKKYTDELKISNLNKLLD